MAASVLTCSGQQRETKNLDAGNKKKRLVLGSGLARRGVGPARLVAGGGASSRAGARSHPKTIIEVARTQKCCV